MQIKIINWDSPDNPKTSLKAVHYWISPCSQYVLIERYRSELFVFAKVISCSPDQLVCTFLESYSPSYYSIDLRSYDVDWSCLPQGFCQLLRTEFDSGFQGTDRRFYTGKVRKE